MKNALPFIVAAAIGGTALAQGRVDVFLTKASTGPDSPGLTRPEKAFDPTGHASGGTEYSGYDLSDWGDGAPYALNDAVPAVGDPIIQIGAGDYYHIWVKMTQVRKNVKLQGLHLGWETDDCVEIQDLAYYIVDDLNGDVGAKRWDGVYTMPDEPEFATNPQNLAAVTSAGLKNTDSAPYNMMLQSFYGNEVSVGMPPVVYADSIYLLGALRADCWGAARDVYAVEGYLGSLAYAFEGGYDVDEFVIHGLLLPEPTSMLLLSLLALGVRRR